MSHCFSLIEEKQAGATDRPSYTELVSNQSDSNQLDSLILADCFLSKLYFCILCHMTH